MQRLFDDILDIFQFSGADGFAREFARDRFDEEKITPGDGIYAVHVKIQNSKFKIQNLYKGMMSIGVRPTVDGTKRVIEVNIFDFDKDIYGETIRVYVKKYLRPEIKFDTIDKLVEQIGQDKIDSLKVL